MSSSKRSRRTADSQSENPSLSVALTRKKTQVGPSRKLQASTEPSYGNKEKDAVKASLTI